MLTPIIIPILVMFIFKIIGANLMRLYLRMVYKKTLAGGTNNGNNTAPAEPKKNILDLFVNGARQVLPLVPPVSCLM